jgi:hypothetical protein
MKTMKTSKIILIGFFSLTGLFLLSLLIQVDKEQLNAQYEKAAIALPPFRHLVLINSAYVDILQSDSDSALYLDTTTEAVMPVFELKGDTLELSWPNHDADWGRYIYSSNLKTVSVKNSYLRMRALASDSIWFFAEAGEIYIDSDNENEFIALEMNDKSFVRINSSLVKSVDAYFKNSSAELHIEQIEKLKAELQDSSTLSTWKVLHTDVTSDSTSRHYSR